MISEIDIKDMDNYQNKAFEYALPQSKNLNYMIPGLAGEVGEVASLYAKCIRDANGALIDHSEQIAKELGDCLWFIASIAKMHNIKLSEIANRNLDKLAGRKERGTIQGSGDDR